MHLDINRSSLFVAAPFSDFFNGGFGVSIEDVEIRDTISREEWSCHGSVKVPVLSVAVEDAVSYGRDGNPGWIQRLS